MGVPVGRLGHGVVLGQELAGRGEEACLDGSLEKRGWETRGMGQQREARGLEAGQARAGPSEVAATGQRACRAGGEGPERRGESRGWAMSASLPLPSVAGYCLLREGGLQGRQGEAVGGPCCLALCPVRWRAGGEPGRTGLGAVSPRAGLLGFLSTQDAQRSP